MEQDHSKRAKPYLPLASLDTSGRTATAAGTALATPTTTPLPIIPTGIETILSPRSTSTKNEMLSDELYDERRSLRREWIRFMDSMDSEDELASSSIDGGGKNDRYSFLDSPYDVELCYPTATNTNTAHLNSLFSGSLDDDESNDYDTNDEYNNNKDNDDKDILDTFRSLKEQVDHLDGILDEFSVLPNSPPASNKSSIIFPTVRMIQPSSNSVSISEHRNLESTKSPKNTLKRGLYDECDTFEDEWAALNKLELELRQELKSVSMDMDNQNYEKENNDTESDQWASYPTSEDVHKRIQLVQQQSKSSTPAIQHNDDPVAVRDRVSALENESNNQSISKVEPNPVPAIVELTNHISQSTSDEELPSALFMKCVFNTEISCTPKACSSVCDQDNDDWDVIAAHRNEFDPSSLLSSQSLLPDRQKVLSPISESSLEKNEFSSPLSTQSTFTKAEKPISPEKRNQSEEPAAVSYKVMVSSFKHNTGEDENGTLGRVGGPEETNASIKRGSSNSIIQETELESQPSDEEKNKPKSSPKICPIQSTKRSVPKPVSYTIMVPSFSKTDDAHIDTTIDGSKENLSKSISETYNKIADELDTECESRDEENYLDSHILVLPTKSASTLTREEGPSNGSINSHDAILNEILLEDETEIDPAKDDDVSEQSVLRDILSERDEVEERKSLLLNMDRIKCSKVEIPSPSSPFGEYAAKTPANHHRSVTINNFDIIRSVDDDVERKSPTSMNNFGDTADNVPRNQSPISHMRKSPVPTKKEAPFLSPYLSFELDAGSNASVDLMTEGSTPTKKERRKSGIGTIVKEQTSAMQSGVMELALLDAEDSDGYVSPLTSPMTADDPNEVNHFVGQICAKIGDVLVLDQQDRKSSEVPDKDPIMHQRNEHFVEDFNGIETILAREVESNERCNVEEPVSNPPNLTKKLTHEDEIEAVEFNISEIDSSASITGSPSMNATSRTVQENPSEGDIIPDVASINFCEDRSEGGESPIPTECLETKLLSLNERLLFSIVSREFVTYTELTMKDILGIEWQGDILQGRNMNWEAEQLRRVPVKEHSQPYEVSIKQCSIQQLSPDVVLTIYTLVESQHDVPKNIFRETRLWKKSVVEDHGEWKNCHVHRSKVVDTPSLVGKSSV